MSEITPPVRSYPSGRKNIENKWKKSVKNRKSGKIWETVGKKIYKKWKIDAKSKQYFTLFCKEKSKDFNVAKHYGGEWQIKSNYFFWNTQEGEGSRENPVDWKSLPLKPNPKFSVNLNFGQADIPELCSNFFVRIFFPYNSYQQGVQCRKTLRRWVIMERIS